MDTRIITLFVFLILLISGCGKEAEGPDPHTLEGKLAADAEKFCFQSPQGLMVKKNTSGAVWSCQEAALQGDVNAQFSLGLLSGGGKESAKWFRMAAEQGHARSQLILGTMYIDGEGVPQDIVSAHMWISIASRDKHYVPKDDLSETEKQKYLQNEVFLRKTLAELIEQVEIKMTANQIAEAKKLAE